jgi:hypothetical protein
MFARSGLPPSSVRGRQVTSRTVGHVAVALLGVAALSGLSCVKDFVSAPAATRQERSFVDVRPRGAVLHGPGTTFRFTAEALDAQGFVLTGEPIVWASLNPAVAAVDSLTGLVQAVASGQAIVTARAQSLQPTAVVVTVTADGGAGVELLQADSTGIGADIAAIWGASPAAVYAVGSGGTLLWRTGGRWVPVETGVRQDLSDVWGATADTVWVVGAGGTLLRCAARVCEVRTAPTAATLSGLWGASADSFVVVGAAGTILRWARMPGGAAWRQDSSGTRQHLRAVWGAASDDIFAVGDAGTILHFDGHAWAPMASGVGVALLAVWGAGPDEVFAVGDGGVVVRYEGHGWTSVPTGTGALLEDVWGTGPQDVYFVGTGSTLLRWDGASLSALAGPGTGDLSAIWGTSAGVVYVGGPGGTFYRGALDEAARVVFASSPPASLRAGERFGLEVRAVTGRGATDAGFRDTVRLTVGRGPAGGAVHGTLTAVADSGRAVFPDLWLDKAASSYTLRAAAPGLAAGETRSFILRPGPPSRLHFTTQPADTVAGNTLAPVRAGLTDLYGNIVADSGVTVGIGLAVPGAVLTGTALRTTEHGTATFDDLLLLAAGTGYRLIVASAGLQADTSQPFAIRPGPLDRLVLDPVGASVSGAGTTQAFTVPRGLDRYGNSLPAPGGITWSSLNPRVATVDATTGVATAHSAGQVNLVATAGNLAQFVLLTVAIPGVPAVTAWTPVPSPTSSHLWGIWGASENAIYAVGEDATLVVFDGASWTAQRIAKAGTTTLRAVWGYAPGHIVMVGGYLFAATWDDGVTTQYPGTWQCASLPIALTSVWGSSPKDVHVAGVTGGASESTHNRTAPAPAWPCAARWNGTEWSGGRVGGPTWVPNAHWLGLWGLSEQEMWLGGVLDGIRRGVGAGWPAFGSGYCLNCWGLWGVAPTDLFAAWADIFERYAGGLWSQLASTSDQQSLFAVWGTSASDVYAVGAEGTILHWDGSTVTSMNSGTTNDLLGIWGTENVVYVVGANGIILRGTH